MTESFLAGRLRTSRGQVRSALRQLERDGLLTATSGRAAVVPIMTAADVIELYAARRALGAIVVRAATRWRPEGRLAYRAARVYLGRVVPALSRLSGGPRAGLMMRYYWDTIDACVPPATILAALAGAGFAAPRCETQLGLFRASMAERPA